MSPSAVRARHPLRTCVGCRRTVGPDALVRVVCAADGRLTVGRHLPGRGAWLCAGSGRCVADALKRQAFSRAFRRPVIDIDNEGLRAEVIRATVIDDPTTGQQ